MTKELKAFEKLDNTLCLNNIRDNIEFGIDTEEHIDCNNVVEMAECLDIVGNALKELKQIKDTDPSEALECLERLGNDEFSRSIDVYVALINRDVSGTQYLGDTNEFAVIKQALLNAEKLKKAWDIVKEKKVILYAIQECDSIDKYNLYVEKCFDYGIDKQLAEEEFDLLKEMIANV